MTVEDPIKPSAAEAIRHLHAEGLRLVMLTGDIRATAQAVADAVGIDEVIAEVQPDQKRDVIERLQREGRVVAMAGDGINDAPALAAASVGIAMGSGNRRRHRERRHHPRRRRPGGHRPRAAAQPRDDAQHPSEPVLGLRL